MASTAAERKAKQRQEMIEKGYVRKDIWLSKENLDFLNKYKESHDLKSNDEAINNIIQNISPN